MIHRGPERGEDRGRLLPKVCLRNRRESLLQPTVKTEFDEELELMMRVKFKIEKNEGYKYISTIEGLGIKKGVGNFG